MKHVSRRTFLKATAAGALAAYAPGAAIAGSNDRIRVAVIGLGNKGPSHVSAFGRIPGVRVAALCDVDPERLGRHVGRLDKDNGKVFSTTDCRRILDRSDIDIVVIATCNHWHALLAVWACQAGKDVYVEKPVSHNIVEGQKIIAAAAKYKRIVQSGTQYRSCVGLREAAEYIHAGSLGKMLWGHVLWYERRGSIGKKDPWTPDDLDYDLYCGPAPKSALRRNQLHYDWHWVWSTGDGDLANSGIHAFDVCRWFAGYQNLPEKSMCIGGRFGVDDAGQTPNTQLTVLDYAPAPIVIENRNLPARKGTRSMDQHLGVREGIIFKCENGYFAGFRGGGWAYDNDGKKLRQFKGDGGGGHQANFIDAVRSRKPETLRAHIRQGHISSGVCHLGNVSYRLGSPCTIKDAQKQLADWNLASEVLERIDKHLTANEVNLKQTPLALGPWLTLDPETETVIKLHRGRLEDSPKPANKLFTGQYRAPFVMPDNV